MKSSKSNEGADKKQTTKSANHFGFSLIELLIVLTIISVMIGIAVGVGNNAGSNFEVFTTSRSCAALFEEARESAVKFSSNIKILVLDDAARSDDNGRVVQVVREIPGEAGEASIWEAYQNPFLLSDGIFYSPEYSTFDDASGPENFIFEGSNWLAYDVSKRGYFKNSGALFVIIAGVRDSEQIVEKEEKRGGFMIQKRGRPVELTDLQLLTDNE